MKSRTLIFLALLTCCAVLPSTAPADIPTPPSAGIYLRFAGEAEEILQKHILDQWFPRAIDRENGGFKESFSEDWTPGANSQKSIVYQSRLTWLSARAAAHDKKRAEEYKNISRHGIRFLAEKQWDKRQGGLFWAVDNAGNPAVNGNYKHPYGLSFAIYAAAANYEVTGDNDALELAIKTFLWLDANSHDEKYGGYFEAIASAKGNSGNPMGARAGQKSMNTHIHVLEAFTQLYSVWPDKHLRKRTEEVLDICLNKIYSNRGYLHMFSDADWTPGKAQDSYGHDIETGYLAVEAAEALGKHDDQRTWTVARNLVDHGLEFGFDKRHGGFYDVGSPTGEDVATEKIWWVQAEGLNVLLLMHECFGKESPEYWNAFVKQWDFIKKYQIDHAHGGWYPKVHEDGTPITGRPKSDSWTEGYHQGRSMMNVIERLRRLAKDTAKPDNSNAAPKAGRLSRFPYEMKREYKRIYLLGHHNFVATGLMCGDLKRRR
jgi:cellobiose epimerase